MDVKLRRRRCLYFIFSLKKLHRRKLQEIERSSLRENVVQFCDRETGKTFTLVEFSAAIYLMILVVFCKGKTVADILLS